MKQISETIDGSMKDILQLKTLDNSLEYSQMYDALEDTPRDFQTKLIDALNSLAQTMGCFPEEAFNKVLCKSDDGNEEVTKKLYNWWRAFFEVLGKCEKVPTVRVSEFNQKIDDLMAEIMKAGDSEATDEEEPVMESDDGDLGYQQATKDDEDKMLADMDFAVQHIGEIANKVKDVVNFINPYCETTFNEEEVQNNMKFKKIDERAGGDSDEWVSMDDFVGEEFGESDDNKKQFGEARVVVDANDVWEVLDLLDNDIAKKELTDLINSHSRTEAEIMDAINELCGETISKKELNTLISGKMSTIVDFLGLDVERYESNGDFVDSDKPTSVELEGSDDGIKGGEVKDGEKQVTQDGDTKTLVTGSDNNKQKVNEMTIEQEIDDPWKLYEMLWGQGKENLRDLLESELIDEEFLMQCLEDMEIKNLTNINDAFAFDFPTILDMLGLDGKAWSRNLEIKRKDEYDSDED